METNIILFTMDGCGHCYDLKNKLNEEQILFNEIEINKNKHIWDQVVDQTGHNVVPTLFLRIENTDDGEVFIPGKDFNNRDEAVEIVKKYIL
jgi:glutaredoxin